MLWVHPVLTKKHVGHMQKEHMHNEMQQCMEECLEE